MVGVNDWISGCLINRFLCLETGFLTKYYPLCPSRKVIIVKSIINISNNGETGSAVFFTPLRLNTPQGHYGS